MNNLTCVVCGKPLTGGTDTFGDIAAPMCQADYLEDRIDELRKEAEPRL